ncbi:hypothetical protein [Clostridium tyrobutyricum]|uniref:hypothetical protein n=1 Tax=Clostridium tyrobutyricum TaxID=1519 RepID=UPI00073D5DB6|nr:hypothetical protein [Clostridium tyrobutyricum]
MSQKIIDLNAMKYRDVCCPNCERCNYIEINNIIQDEYGEMVNEYICNKCDEIFTLNEEDTIYEEGAFDEERWHDLTEDMKFMLKDYE